MGTAVEELLALLAAAEEQDAFFDVQQQQQDDAAARQHWPADFRVVQVRHLLSYVLQRRSMRQLSPTSFIFKGSNANRRSRDRLPSLQAGIHGSAALVPWDGASLQIPCATVPLGGSCLPSLSTLGRDHLEQSHLR
jgi:hypothetical protein